MTFTTIGYGDIVPYTNIERIFDIVAMLIGALVFGYIIGAVGNVVQQRSGGCVAPVLHEPIKGVKGSAGRFESMP
jgi:hypothetical protein